MRLLASPHPTAGRVLPLADFSFTAILLGWLVGLEVAGRLSASDMQDVLAAVGLGFAVAVTVNRHRRRPLPWASWLVARMNRLAVRFERMKYDHGIDLRGEPPIRRQLPRGAWGLAAGLVGWGVAAGAGWYFFPGGWRDFAAHTFYLGYLVGLAVVWIGLLACVAAGVYLPVMMFDSALRRWFPDEPDRRRAELGLLFGYALTTFAVASFVPTGAVLGLCLAVAAVAVVFAARAGGSDPAILWRNGPGRKIRAVPLHRLVGGTVALVAVLVFDLLLTACGGRLFGDQTLPESMPITALLGMTAAWLTPGAGVLAAFKMLTGLRDDPARTTPLTVRLRGDHTAAVRSATRMLRGWGWKVQPGSDADPSEVTVEVVSPERSEATEFEPTWPLKVTVADLGNPNVKDRLFRRDEIQLRRRVSRGLANLFKKTAGAPRKVGGHWFAPHWWFVDSLGREEPARGKGDDTGLRPVGPPYAEAFGPRARQHLYRVFRAARVDMVYVEAGIGHRSLDRVLRALYELYDVHGGKRQAEDHHFRGVPKVRVMIHDYAPGSRFKATGYKEPGFDELSRARVLHVFKDRGAHEELEDVPFDQSWEPAPAMGMG